MIQIGPFGIFLMGCFVGALTIVAVVVVAAVVMDKKGK